MPKRTAGLVALVVSSVLLRGEAGVAQGTPSRPGSATEREAVDRTPSVVFEFQQMRVRIEADGTSTREMTMRVRANDELGVRQVGQIPLVYAPDTETLSISKLEVRKHGGEIVHVGPEAVQEHAIQPGAQTPMLVDLRQKLVTVPALRPRDTIVVTAVWTVGKPLAPKHSWYQHSFIKHAIADEERLEIDLPADLKFIVRASDAAPREMSQSVGRLSGGRRILEWRTSNPKLPDDGADAPDETPPADIRVTTFESWDAFASWISPLFQSTPDATVRAKALELTKGQTDSAARIETLYKYVSTQIRYVSLSFGIGRYMPHPPAEVLKNQYGDCKDKHALLAAMLDAIGVASGPVLINSGRSIADDMPSPAEFDHVITLVPRGRDPETWLWLDTTSEVAPQGLLVASLRNRRAFYAGGAGMSPRIVTTPRGGPFPFVDTIEIAGKISPLGVLDANVRLSARGDTELIIRAALRMQRPEALNEFTGGLARALGLPASTTDSKASDPLATDEPVHVAFTTRRAGFLDWAAASSSLETGFGTIAFDLLDGDLFPLKRDTPLVAAAQSVRRATIELPPGYTATAPADVRLSKHGFTFSAIYSVSGSRLTIERTLSSTASMLEAVHALDYTGIARTIKSDLAQKFAIRRVSATRPEIPSDTSASELYHAAFFAYEAKDYDTALAFWNRNTEMDPKMGKAWGAVGLTLRDLKRFEEAAVALEKQIAVDPSNKKAYADLGYVLQEARKYEAAAKAYTTHLERNPLDGESQRHLGEIYLELKRYPEAAAAIDRAALQLPKDDWVRVLQGTAYLRLGQLEKARSAFEQALTLDDEPSTWTKIAWELADNGVDAPFALKLIEKTTARVTRETARAHADKIDPDLLDLMEDLAWAWDARGLIELKAGNVDGALSYLSSAWTLGGEADVAEHLADALEKRGRKADALSTLLTARAVTKTPTASLTAQLSRMAGTDKLDHLLDASSVELLRSRGIQLPLKNLSGAAVFTTVVEDGKIHDIAFSQGTESLRVLGAALKGRQLPITNPGEAPLRLVVRLKAYCNAEGCGAVMVPAWIEDMK
jgi:tetratricopeptide (TPR) repeat protein